MTFKHEEGNEGEKTGVKRGIGAFYGGKLLKRQGELPSRAVVIPLGLGPHSAGAGSALMC